MLPIRRLGVILSALLAMLSVAGTASAYQTIVVNRGYVAFVIENNGSRAVLAGGGASTNFGWGDVDSYTLGSGVCASVSVNGGPWYRRGPGYVGLPDAARDVQVRTFWC